MRDVEVKTCCNCKYEDLYVEEYPCDLCGCLHTYWEPKEPEIFNVGDRVELVEDYSYHKCGDRGKVTGTRPSSDPNEVALITVRLYSGATFAAFQRRFKRISCAEEDNKPETKDRINHPNHYNWLPNGIECQDVVSHFPYNVGVAMAYLWRVDHKGTPIEDLRKARKHIDFELARRGVHDCS